MILGSTNVIDFTAFDPISQLTNGWLGEFNIWTILIRVALTITLAAFIGVERSNKRHTAGFRTFILVSLFACLAALFDIYFTVNFGEIFPAISCAIVIGGAIVSGNTLLYSSKSQIKGLTTATALWLVSLIGLCFGAGLYTAGILGAIAIYIILFSLPRIEIYLKNRSNHFEIHLELKNKTNLVDFTTVIRQLGLKIDDIESNPAYANSGLSVYTVSLTIISKELKKYKTHTEIIEALKSIDYINAIEEID